jgi:hypothetical protein
MPEIPEDSFTFWLFAENLTENSTFEFVEFKPEYETRKGNKIPVFVLLGSDKEREGEFLLAVWNVANIKQLKEQLGSNSDTWGTPMFKATAKGKRIILEVQK